MTDTEMQRRKAICDVAGVDDIGELSDGFHTFNGLYEQRMILFAALVKAYRDNAWKSYRNEDGEYCFGGGWFIVGIDTPEGSYTYHYEDNYFSLFDCEELEYGKHLDGHTEKDVTRLLFLPSAQPEKRTEERMETHACDCIDRQAAIRAVNTALFPKINTAKDAEKALRDLPSAQPEIIHCKECKYGVQDEGKRWYCRGLGCQVGEADGSGFCADAERRE